MPAEVRAAWRGRYFMEAETEFRVQALLDRAAAALRSDGDSVTIRTLWMALADRAGWSGDADLRVAAALAGMAMGLRPLLTAEFDRYEAQSLFKFTCSKGVLL